jgi:hypothetical protein
MEKAIERKRLHQWQERVMMLPFQAFITPATWEGYNP